MPEKSRLMPISYYNPKQEIRLSAYADTIVLEPDGRKQHLRAIRFGGYPEMVRAMADAIYAGATLEAEIAGEAATLSCEPKKYERHLSHDGIYCTKKKKPRLLKRWHKMLRVPDWCKKRIRPSLVRIYDFASTESWLMHENLCKSLGREIAPTASRYTLSEVRQLDLDAYAFQKQAQTTPVEELLGVHLGLHQVVEVFDGVQSVILYKTLDGFVPVSTFDAERARQNRREQKKATA